MRRKVVSVVLSAAMMVSMAGALTAFGGETEAASGTEAGTEAFTESPEGSGLIKDGVFSIANECGYAPYNWSQPDDSNDSVPIEDTSEYSNGYDVMIAKKICDAYGWKLKVNRLDWDSLIPAVQSGQVDAIIAGQSMTAERAKQVDFAGPYLYATIVVVTKKDSKFASAKGISDLSGGKCTSQMGTIWYDTCLPQIEGADVQEAAESAPAMLMALETGAVDYVCTDMPTAQGAVAAYPDLTILDFSGSDDDFKVSDEDVNIGISVKKGNTALKSEIDAVLNTMDKKDYDDIMADAIKIQPITNN